eukprot:CAMPEP_0202693420 /NCGR_PEP_ID=MMETSP1385-20130828/7543_1 /ASSEMBLY_ACC=CAM_ASM_000861 /TAXON_ID=933848 /ORGANISM="Elphidium margaritaceum" /LENGTH=280 /DNA_ID=CAMNT_0049349097 /DNA_START=45 /DNA_END=883 /DNA_ORIENTATION=-
MSWASSFWFYCTIAVCASTKLYFTNNSMSDTYPGVFVVSYDTESRSLDSYPADIPPQSNPIAKGDAIICDSVYYTYWTTDFGAGFFIFDTNENRLLSYFQEPTSGDYLAFGCTSVADTLLLVEATVDYYDVFFGLYSAKFHIASNSVEKELIAYLPREYGYPFGSNIFSFNSDFSELWVSAMSASNSHGQLLIVDTETGKLKESYSYPSNVGFPYFTIPSTLSSLGTTFKGAVVSSTNSTVADYVTVTMNADNELTVKTQVKNASYLYGDGLPLTVCGDT